MTAGAAVRLDHVGLNVRDLTTAERWYRAAFGLAREFAARIDAVGLDIVMLRGAAGHRVELLHRDGSRPGPRAADPAEAALTEGYGHIAFDVAELDAEHRRLCGLGARQVMAPQPSPEPGVRMSFLADPEGNLIELVERSPAHRLDPAPDRAGSAPTG
jgi:catechol 2,3-dioxygenase-like lactoylglutathione lyase family enzyme